MTAVTMPYAPKSATSRLQSALLLCAEETWGCAELLEGVAVQYTLRLCEIVAIEGIGRLGTRTHRSHLRYNYDGHCQRSSQQFTIF